MTSRIRQLLAEYSAEEKSARRVVDETLQQIEALDSRMNAFITIAHERAASQAKRLSLLHPNARPPLYGVPIAVKDCFRTAGLRTTCGSSSLSTLVPARSAALVDRLDRAGAVLVGKTTMDEFGWGFSHEFGSARNPFDTHKVSGGSSGGSATSVGCGMVPVALGSDSGGSVRLPASYCGVVGFKPTPGVLDPDDGMPGACTLDSGGILAHTAEDVSLTFSTLASNRRLNVQRSSNRAVVIGVPFARLEFDHGKNAELFDWCLNRLGRSCTIVDVSFPAFDDWVEIWLATFAHELAASLRAANLDLNLLSDDTKKLISYAEALDRDAYSRFQRDRAKVSEDLIAEFASVDVLLTPTAPNQPPERDAPMATVDATAIRVLYYTGLANLARLPAVSIPIRNPADAVGAQLVGPALGDLTLLAYASRIHACLAPADCNERATWVNSRVHSLRTDCAP